MLNLTIRHYRAFAAVADLRSFTEAARRCCVTPSALSQMVKDVESQLGFPLFERRPRAVGLTQPGAAFLPHALRVLAEHAAAEQAAAGIRGRKSGLVRIAATQLISGTFLPELAVAIMREHPGIALQLVDVEADQLQARVSRGEADLGLGPERVCDGDVTATPVCSSVLHFLCAPGHRLARRRRVSWAELADERLIFVDRRSAALISRDTGHRPTIESWLEVKHVTTALALAAQDHGSFVGGMYAAPMARAYGLRMIPVCRPEIRRTIMAYARAGIAPSPAAARVLDELVRRCAHRWQPQPATTRDDPPEAPRATGGAPHRGALRRRTRPPAGSATARSAGCPA